MPLFLGGGLLTALNVGSVEITATSKQYTLQTNTVSIEITSDGAITPIEGVTPIIGETSSMQIDTERQYTAGVLPATADQTIIWSVDQIELATISETGLLHALAIGVVEITATSAIDHTKFSQVTITIVLPLFPIEVEEELTPINGPINLTIGEDAVYTAAVLPSDTDQSLIWTVDNPLLATISSEGVLHALSQGSVTIRATRVIDENQFVQLIVSILPAEEIPPVGVESVNPIQGLISLTVGDSEQYSATVSPNNADQSMLWSVDNLEIASISATGLLTTISSGSVKVIATSAIDSTKHAELLVTIAALEIPVESVSPIIGSTSIKLGSPSQYSASVLPSTVSQEIFWSVDTTSLATISNSGLLTPLLTGTIKVIATSTLDTSKVAELNITINPADPVSITLNGTNSLVLGTGVSSYSASILPVNALQDLIWVLDGESATGEVVGENYLLTPISAGSVVLTVKSVANNEILETLSITISLPPVTGMEVGTFSTTILVDEEINLEVSLFPALASQAVITSSESSAIVEIIGTHLVGISEGTTTITITSAKNPTIYQTFIINVTGLAERMNTFLHNLSNIDHKIVSADNSVFLYQTEIAKIFFNLTIPLTEKRDVGILYSDVNSAWNLIAFDERYALMGYAAYIGTEHTLGASSLDVFQNYQAAGMYELNEHGTISMTDGYFLYIMMEYGMKSYTHLEFDLAQPNYFLAYYGDGISDYDLYNITLGHPDELNELEAFADHYEIGYVIGQFTELLIAAAPATAVSNEVAEAILVPNPDNYGYRLYKDENFLETEVYTSPQLMSIHP
ncbi:hypothetical protein EZS27_026276, partial [termite gut metagenome]